MTPAAWTSDADIEPPADCGRTFSRDTPLSLILDEATVHMGRRADADNTVRLTRYRLRTSDRATVADLDNYLSADAVFL